MVHQIRAFTTISQGEDRDLKEHSNSSQGFKALTRILVNTILLYIFWLALVGFELWAMVYGVVVVIVCQFFFAPRLKLFHELRYDLGSLCAFLCFCFNFASSLLSSNIDVASRVIKPSLPIAPGILEIKTKLKADLAIMLISYAITLTPGTIMIETRDDSLFVHAINVDSEEAVAKIHATISLYEKYLGRMFY